MSQFVSANLISLLPVLSHLALRLPLLYQHKKSHHSRYILFKRNKNATLRTRVFIKDLISGPVDRGLSFTTQVVGARELNSYSTLCEQIQAFREDLTKRSNYEDFFSFYYIELFSFSCFNLKR